MDPTPRFTDLVQGPEASLPLDEAALLIAAHAHPDLDVEAGLRHLDDLAAGCEEPTLDGLRRHLFRDLGFSGNAVDYYDPRNSYLDDVLERRTGIPITLSILAMEVGRRIGARLAGVSMPGHFLLRDRVDPDVFLDPFSRGALLDRRACEARFRAVQGPGAAFDPAFLEPVGRQSILVRVLTNLRAVHQAASDTAALAWVLRLRLAIPEVDRGERRTLASVLAAQGRVHEAADELDRLAGEVGPGGVAAAQATAAAQRLRASLN